MTHPILSCSTLREKPTKQRVPLGNATGATRRSGSISVFLAISITVLLAAAALGVDYGVLVADKNHAQRAVDAAALAGAAQLKSEGDQADMENARHIAVVTAAANGVTIDPASITFDSNATQIRVPATIHRQLFFARVMGISTGHVAAAATAEVVPTDKPSDINVVPIGITWNTYLGYTKPLNTSPEIMTLIRPQDTVYDLNKFVLFDLRANNAKSPAAMVNQLLTSDREMVQLGQYETTLNANDSTVGTKFEAAMAEIFLRAAAPPWNDTWTGNLFTSTGIRYNEILAKTAQRDNPRVMYFVVNPDNTTAQNGSYDTQIQGFAPVYVESFQKTVGLTGSLDTQLTVRFLPPSTNSDGNGSAPGAEFSGTRTIRLIN